MAWKSAAATPFPPALARTRDGALHLLWRRGPMLMHSYFTAAGEPSGPAVELAPGRRPRLIATADGGLAAVFEGAAGEIHAAASKDGGQNWELARGSQSALRYSADAFVALAADKESKPLLAHAAAGRVSLQAGFGAAPTAEKIRDAACCVQRVEAAVDAESGETWLMWRQSGPKEQGVYVKAARPSTGAPQLAPGSALSTAFALTPRTPTFGIFAVYRAGVEVKLWNVRGGEALTVAKAAARHVWIGPAPEGRLWIAWIAANGAVFAVRSNKALTRFSAPYALGIPAVAPASHLACDGSTGPLDVFVHAGGAVLHQRLPAGVEVPEL